MHEGPDEAQPEGSLKQELGFPLVLCQTKEGHVSQVLLGRLQEKLGPLLLWDSGHVVAADEAQVCQHANLQAGEKEGGRLEKPVDVCVKESILQIKEPVFKP